MGRGVSTLLIEYLAMARLWRHFVIFAILGIAVLDVVSGLRQHVVGLSLAPVFFRPLAGLVGLFVGYILLVFLVAYSGRLCFKRAPNWGERLIRLQGLLTGGHMHLVSLLALSVDNPAKADQIWSKLESRLANLPAGAPVALASMYAISISKRGQTRRACDLLLQYESSQPSTTYAGFYSIYWALLGWCRHDLGEFEEADCCLNRALQQPTKLQIVRTNIGVLRALLTHERGNTDEAICILNEDPNPNGLAAWLLVELGELKAAEARLPKRADADRTPYYLAQASITNSPELLKKVDRVTGLVAYHAIKHFNDSSYLAEALQNDPESIWTKRAQAAGS